MHQRVGTSMLFPCQDFLTVFKVGTRVGKNQNQVLRDGEKNMRYQPGIARGVTIVRLDLTLCGQFVIIELSND